jgi:hypothetical protein
MKKRSDAKKFVQHQRKKGVHDADIMHALLRSKHTPKSVAAALNNKAYPHHVVRRNQPRLLILEHMQSLHWWLFSLMTVFTILLFLKGELNGTLLLGSLLVLYAAYAAVRYRASRVKRASSSRHK